MLEIDIQSKDFDLARDAVAEVRGITAAAAAKFLCLLRATQFERLVNASKQAVADRRCALVQIALAQTLAEMAQAAAHRALTSLSQLAAGHDVAGATTEFIGQAEDLANQSLDLATKAANSAALADDSTQNASSTETDAAADAPGSLDAAAGDEANDETLQLDVSPPEAAHAATDVASGPETEQA